MEDELYRQQILAVFNNMQNKRVIPDANHVLEGFNASCGDKITIYILTKGEEIIDMSFSGDGCLLSQISAELLAAYAKGKRLHEIYAFTLEDHFDLMGIHPTPARVKCVELPLATMVKMLKEA